MFTILCKYSYFIIFAWYVKNFNSNTNVKVVFNRETGDIKVYSYYFDNVIITDARAKKEVEDNENIISGLIYAFNKNNYNLFKSSKQVRYAPDFAFSYELKNDEKISIKPFKT